MENQNEAGPAKPGPIPPVPATDISKPEPASNALAPPAKSPPIATASADEPAALPGIVSAAPDAPVAADASAKKAAVAKLMVQAKSKMATQAGMALAAKKKMVLEGISDYAVSPKHGKSYAVLLTNGFPEALAIGSQDLNARIRVLIRQRGESIKQRELEDLNEELRSQAEAVGHRLDLYPRVHPLDGGGVEIDLCDRAGTTVRLTAGDVQILRGTSPTLFIRSASAMALPVPAEHGDFMRLRKFLNLVTTDFYLYLGWLTFTIAHPKVESTNYVFLVLKGTQGSGKTFASKSTQKVVDPRSIGAQTLPGSDRELAIVLQSAHLLVVDNLRDITPALSDTLCIASTGGGVGTRKLYTDDEQKTLYLHGQILFNGIHPFMGQSDFADRCLVLDLVPLPKELRKLETAMLAEFEADKPIILRGLYDLVAQTLKHLPDAQIVAPARMLDFCQWLSATEMALQMPGGTLQQLYVDSLREAQLESLLDNPLAVTIIAFADAMEEAVWSGTPTEFYEKLESIANFTSQRSRAWPSSAAVMSKRLHGLQAPLLAQGISVELTRGKEREVVLTKHTNPAPATAPDRG